MMSFAVTPDWRATALAVLLLPLVISLGFWQLQRADEKSELKELQQQRQTAAPVAIESLPAGDQHYRPVLLRGHFIAGRTLFLDNRISLGQFGYEVVMPFQLRDSDEVVLVNRGWIAGDRSRRSLPSPPEVAPAGELLELRGSIYMSQGSLMQLSASQVSNEWPRVSQSIDFKQMAAALGLRLYPHQVRLPAEGPASLRANWMVVNIEPSKHTGYAVQWFAMAVMLLIILVIVNSNIVNFVKQYSGKN
ncbi:MAG: surfeit locus 1 family protein [Paraglaciecola psychrophila]|jgi:surfeit locus 1 family protein